MTVFFVEILVTVAVDSVIVVVFIFSVVVLTMVTVTVAEEAARTGTEAEATLEEEVDSTLLVLLGFDEVEETILDVEEEGMDLDETSELDVLVGFVEELVGMLLDLDEDSELDVLVGFTEEVEETLLDFDEDSELDVLVDFTEELDDTLLDLDDDEEEEPEILLDELVLVNVTFDDVELVGLRLVELDEINVLDVAVVAVHCPVEEGTASTPDPIGIMFVPQLAA